MIRGGNIFNLLAQGFAFSECSVMTVAATVPILQ